MKTKLTFSVFSRKIFRLFLARKSEFSPSFDLFQLFTKMNQFVKYDAKFFSAIFHQDRKDHCTDTYNNLTNYFGILSHQTCNRPTKSLNVYTLLDWIEAFENEQFSHLESFSFFSNMIAKNMVLKFIYSEKATKFCEIFTLLLTGTT